MSRFLTGSSYRQTGFTLIEVLVAIVILSIGLLGVAGLQLTGLRSSNQSSERSIATVLAYDITDRMRANVSAAAAGSYVIDPDNPPTPPNVSSGARPQDFCLTDFNGTLKPGFCSATELATADAFDWFSSVQDILPGGQAQIICIDANTTDGATCSVGSRYLITIMWDDLRTGASGKNCDATDDGDLLCFSITTEI